MIRKWLCIHIARSLVIFGSLGAASAASETESSSGPVPPKASPSTSLPSFDVAVDGIGDAPYRPESTEQRPKLEECRNVSRSFFDLTSDLQKRNSDFLIACVESIIPGSSQPISTAPRIDECRDLGKHFFDLDTTTQSNKAILFVNCINLSAAGTLKNE